MPRGVDHAGGVVAAVGVQVLRPRVVRVAGVRVLRQEPSCLRVVVPRVHVLQARARVAHAARVRRFVQELLHPALFEVPELVVRVVRHPAPALQRAAARQGDVLLGFVVQCYIFFKLIDWKDIIQFHFINLFTHF
jgi:hypothetical protein